jgi:hypothetical protein
LSVKVGIEADAKAAEAAFLAERDIAPDAVDVPDLGEAAFARETGSDSKVVFRIGNLTAEVQYRTERSGSSEQVLKAARWVHKSLQAVR